VVLRVTYTPSYLYRGIGLLFSNSSGETNRAHNTLEFPQSLFEVLVRFGPGECFGIYFSIVCALRASVVPQGLSLQTPSPPEELAFCVRRIL
jgi:hypothetical protein